MRLCSISDCTKRHYAKGLCEKHYDRRRRHGDPLKCAYKRAGTGEARKLFEESTILETNECVVWKYGTNPDGYGYLRINNKHRFTHVLALERRLGIAPTGKPIVLHSCDNPPCFNYRHLRYGTHLENVQDRVSRGRSPRGENHCESKLTEQQVREIRSMVKEKKYSQSSIGKQFGVTQSLVWCIGSGKRWGWLK
jgi:hypothetical protein